MVERRTKDGRLIRELSEQEAKHLPSGGVRIYAFLMPRRPAKEKVRREWDNLTSPEPDMSKVDMSKVEVDKSCLPPPRISLIFKVFQNTGYRKELLTDQIYTQKVVSAWAEAKKLFEVRMAAPDADESPAVDPGNGFHDPSEMPENQHFQGSGSSYALVRDCEKQVDNECLPQGSAVVSPSGGPDVSPSGRPVVSSVVIPSLRNGSNGERASDSSGIPEPPARSRAGDSSRSPFVPPDTEIARYLGSRPIGYAIDERIYQEIAGILDTPELLEQFKREADQVRSPRRWAIYRSIAQKVKARGAIAAAAPAESSSDRKAREFAERYYAEHPEQELVRFMHSLRDASAEDVNRETWNARIEEAKVNRPDLYAKALAIYEADLKEELCQK